MAKTSDSDHYIYDSDGDLESVTTPSSTDYSSGKKTVYTYRKGTPTILATALASVTFPREVDSNGPARLTWDYFTTGAYTGFVMEHGVGNGAFSYSYSQESVSLSSFNTNPANTPVMVTTVTDRRGVETVVVMNYLGQMCLETVTDNLGLRGSEAPDSEYTREFEYTQDGLLKEEIKPLGNKVEYTYPNPSTALRISMSNQLTKTLVPDSSRSHSQSDLEWSYVYEPYFNKKLSVTDPRQLTTTYTYDYMESLSAGEADLAASMGYTVAELQSVYPAGFGSKGEVNDDGVFQYCGNLIKIDYETVILPSQATSLGISTTQEANVRIHYNAVGQRIAQIDEEENVTEWRYFEVSGPLPSSQAAIWDEVSGITTSPSSAGGGYLAEMSADTTSSEGRNSATDPTPVSQTTSYSYDSVGSFPANYYGVPTKRVDPRGIETHYEVNAHDQVLTELRAAAVPSSGPFASLTAFAYERETDYDLNDKVSEVRVEDSGNHTSGFIRTTYEYDILDFVTEMVEDAGASNEIVTRYEYDNSTNRTAIVRGYGSPAQSRTEWTYDERDIVIATKQGVGGSEPSENSVTVTRIDQNGNVVELVDAVDTSGAKTTETNLQGESTIYDFDGFDRLISTQDRVGTTTTLEYDAASNVINELVTGTIDLIGSPGSSVRLAETDWEYDARNRNVRQDRHLFTYSGYPSTVSLDAGSLSGGSTVASILIYDRASRVQAHLDAESDVTRTFYDGLGRTIEVVDPVGNQVVYVYDAANNLTTVTETDNCSTATNVGVDEVFVTELEYDALSRRTKMTEPNGQETDFVYDSRDNAVQRTDAEGNVVVAEHDRFNRLTRFVKYLGAGGVNGTPSSHADGTIDLQQEWDDLYRLTKQIDDNGNETEYEYDGLGNVIAQTFGDDTTETYAYNADSELRYKTDQTGYFWEFVNDARGRPLASFVKEPSGIAAEDLLIFNGATSASPGGPSTSEVQGAAQFLWSYDGLDRIWNHRALNSVVGADDIDTVIWRDSLGRRIREVQTIGGIASTTVDVGWQGSQRMIAEIYPTGPGGSPRRVNRTYDGLDRLVSVVEDSTSAVITEIEYIGGRVAWMEYGNGTTLDKTDGTSTTIGHGYDTNRRHLLHEWKDGSTVITSYENTYNATNRRTTETRNHLPGSPAPQDVYTFDSAYRMVGFDRAGASAASTRELDGAGKMTSYVDEGTTITPMIDTDVGEEGLNQYSEFVGTRTYNDNGDLVLAPGRKYEYDVAGRLFASNDTSGGGSTTIAKYCHDGMNRRVAKLFFSGGSLTRVIRYACNGWCVVEEQEAANMTALEVARQYVDGAGIDDHIQMVTYTGSGTGVAVDETYYYHSNSQGFVGALTDDSGARVDTYEYKWLGEPLSTSSVGNPYLWQGRYYDEEIEWYYFRNRYYEPRTGDFATIDPSGLWRHGQGSGYSAFDADTWNARDPLGLDVWKENTKGAKGFHQRVCVDVWSDCCEYIVGRYCISFGPDTPGFGKNPPPGTPGPVGKGGTRGDGLVQEDNKDPRRGRRKDVVVTSGCAEDRAIKEWFDVLTGRRGDYHWIRNNCRHFCSEALELWGDYQESDVFPEFEPSDFKLSEKQYKFLFPNAR